jgi:hypothetical protein
LKNGDRNTKFFHASLIERKRRNRIVSLSVAGIEITKEDDMKEATSYFKDLFKTTGPRNYNDFRSPNSIKIDADMNTKLTSPISFEEVKEVVEDLGPLKSPGPEGFPGLFFTKFWPEIGNDIFYAIKNIFEKKTF